MYKTKYMKKINKNVKRKQFMSLRFRGRSVEKLKMLIQWVVFVVHHVSDSFLFYALLAIYLSRLRFWLLFSWSNNLNFPSLNWCGIKNVNFRNFQISDSCLFVFHVFELYPNIYFCKHLLLLIAEQFFWSLRISEGKLNVFTESSWDTCWKF